MTEDTEKERTEVHAVAALAYKRACEAFQIATDAHRASVMAYGLAMRVSDDDQFECEASGRCGLAAANPLSFKPDRCRSRQ
jgi:hypothetical protein